MGLNHGRMSAACCICFLFFFLSSNLAPAGDLFHTQWLGYNSDLRADNPLVHVDSGPTAQELSIVFFFPANYWKCHYCALVVTDSRTQVLVCLRLSANQQRPLIACVRKVYPPPPCLCSGIIIINYCNAFSAVMCFVTVWSIYYDSIQKTLSMSQ